MKIDLSRAFDCVDWELLWMILYKIGMGSLLINWIKAYIKTTSLALHSSKYQEDLDKVALCLLFYFSSQLMVCPKN